MLNSAQALASDAWNCGLFSNCWMQFVLINTHTHAHTHTHTYYTPDILDHLQVLKVGVDGQSRASALTFLYNEGVWPSSAEIQITGGAAPTAAKQ